MKKKKTLIVLGIVCASIILLGIVFAVVFRLRTVDVEFRSRAIQSETNLGENVQEKVLDDGGFGFGKNILFMNLNNNVKNIEKQNPYVKVEQVIRYFPGTVRVYISERLPRYRVRDTSVTDRWYILDKDFKVLDIVKTEEIKIKTICKTSTYYNKTIEINPSSFTVSANKGDFINETIFKGYFNQISEGIIGYAKHISVAKRISIIGNDNAKNNVGDFQFEIVMKNSNSTENDDGGKIYVLGSSDLTIRVNHGVHCYTSEIKNETTLDPTTAKVTVDEDANVFVESQKGNYKYNEED